MCKEVKVASSLKIDWGRGKKGGNPTEIFRGAKFDLCQDKRCIFDGAYRWIPEKRRKVIMRTTRFTFAK